MTQQVSTIAVMGIDIGKNSFHIVGLDQRGDIVLRQRRAAEQTARGSNIPAKPRGTRQTSGNLS
jgi:transposase